MDTLMTSAPGRPDRWNRFFSATQALHWRNLPVCIALTAGAVVMLLPFLWMFSASMRPTGEAYQLPPSFLPDRLSADAYLKVLNSPIPFLRMYANSLFVAAVTTAGVALTSATAGFAFARLNFRGKGALFALCLVGFMVPPSLLLVPLFFGFAAAGVLDSIWALILPGLASSLGVFMMRQFMLNQPRELEEAALIDGASYLQVFLKVSLPQMGPPIAALSIITFTQSWNNFVLPLVLTRKAESMTLPVGLLSLADAYGDFSLAALMAAVTMAVTPLFVVFLIGQRFIIESVTHSGLKG